MTHSDQNSITFKPTTQGLQSYVHPFDPSQTVQTIKQAIATHYSVEYYQVKLIHKGKILTDRATAQESHIQGAVVMLVIGKRVESPKKNTTDQTIPRIPSTFNTGMGATLPVGFGGYSIINHPQYMSGISGAVNEEKIDEMLNDPTYMSMMADMMQDPDTIRSLIEENPMLKSMFKDNPSMKAMLDNPQMLKSMFNPEMIKLSRQLLKNGNGVMPNLQMGQPGQVQPGLPGMAGLGGLGSMGGLGGMGGLAGMGGLGGLNALGINGLANLAALNGQQPNQQNNGINPQFGFGNPMMGGFNPQFLMGSPLFQQLTQQYRQQQQQPPAQQQQPPVQVSIEQKYKTQLRELESMGFRDREQNIKALIESKGDVDGAIQRLCQD